mmetsp:Transcript_8914/g.30662  ORF Transcript_8914/g.30662 Transcript_8914/m.30662 type:complete len:86 (-) Transcript_8914:1047-1304(-)
MVTLVFISERIFSEQVTTHLKMKLQLAIGLGAASSGEPGEGGESARLSGDPPQGMVRLSRGRTRFHNFFDKKEGKRRFNNKVLSK